jgi:predicted small lipoprotein YifL
MVSRRIVALLIAALTLAPGLAACGKRGDLIPPAGSTYPQPYPKQ